MLVLAPWTVDAAGLGRLTVQSALGEPFQAEIDLLSVSKDEVGTLSVRLASPNAYQQAGLQYSHAVTGLDLRVERRPNGQPYIKVSSSRPVNEFVVDVLIDLSWSSGRIMREYRVLLDPPGIPGAPAVAQARPAPAAQAPAPRSVPVERAASPAAAPGDYGPVKRGETLSQIARGVRPEGVSMEQTLVGLFRSNPDAFIRNNMNLMRSGRILRVPERQELAAIGQEEAVKEYRAQVADWNSYRQQLAQSPARAPEGGGATAGKIAARVEDTTSGETRDVVRLSKGEPPAGSPGSAKASAEAQAKERIRALEEEIVAREKALSEANERVAQLEKTIKDMQRLVEIKSAGMAAAQQKAETPPKPEAAAKPEATKPEATKPEATAKPEAPPAPKPPTPAVAEAPKPKPPVKPASVPLPAEPSMVETLLANPLYLAALGLVLFGGGAIWLMRRNRREGTRASALFAPGAEPAGTIAAGGAAAAGAIATATPAAQAASEQQPVAEIDPVEEARIYIMHGRDTQAEAILKEGLARNPKREAILVPLLEIYAARKDKASFAQYAADLEKLTGGGEQWLKIAAMGYALDADNPMYAAGKEAAAAAPAEETTRSVDLDLDLDLTAAQSGTPDMNLDASTGSKQAAAPTTEPATSSASGRPAEVAPLDFHIELPPAGADVVEPNEKTDGAAFKLPDIDLNLDDKPAQGAAAAGKDAHWYDVQTKFDLAKAYEEMGDKAGAKGILEEVMREGDAEQQAQARQLLAKLA